ncbi:MAG: MBL fold metallo-hydrolase, partial [Bdellovibrionales bacterium]|nr:MBL fold metallo-hydrolase [Bdellovibrionales bacterium]
MFKIALVLLFLLPIESLWATDGSDLLRLHLLDVGEGSASIVHFPDGKSLLIDSGNLVSGTTVLNYITKIPIDYLDRVIFTHPHLDHIGGAFSILQQVSYKRVHDNGEPLVSQYAINDAYRWYSELVRADKRFRVIRKGERFVYGDAYLDVLWPPRVLTSTDWNTNSIVLRLHYGDFSVLFMGDGNINTEKQLIESGVELKSNVLVAGHHGAEDTVSDLFLSKVSPELTFISVNSDNYRNYPSPVTLSKYRAHRSTTLLSYQSGNVEILSSKSGSFVSKIQ